MNKSILVFLLLLTFILPSSLFAVVPKKPQLLSPKDTLKVLDSVKEHAIVFGSGKKAIHTYIDPYCELSQRYLSFIFKKKERMFSKYTFYFYLYELEGKESSEIILTILSSKYKQTTLKSVMLNHEDVEIDDNGEVQDIVDAIESAAKKIGVFKRPYIIINGKVK